MSMSRLIELARAAVVAADGNREEAARLLRKKLDECPDIKTTITAELLDVAIWDAVKIATTKSNKPATTPHPETVRGVELRSRRNLMNWVLSSGMRLADATQESLIEEIHRHEAAAEMSQNMVAWLRVIAGGLTSGQRVRDRYTNESLETLRRSTRAKRRSA